ncbi:MAG: bifunctional folylpolyglutamate synthase/dihydrofolate synthase [Candidatus Methanoplasma sp.]|jgi:dihydrofolate synthase/folylpolyglutamate synthase|nr:bifunctional folylpolyglutamate synthase/dihydrofolate synthase [Candidatus Methanoplasma sp.]
MEKPELLEWLYGLGSRGIKLGLDNITELMHRLGDPQNDFKSIHVAGTDGKGSVCACIYSIMLASGLRTGLYTSPHLTEFNERIVIDGKEITDDELLALAAEVLPYVREMETSGKVCTFFEVTTAIAFLHFKKEKIEYAVIEVGMGGRLDSTNIISPEVCVIGNVSMEHTEFLGNTIRNIAFEKAGIIKPGVPCVTVNGDDVFGVLSGIADERGAPLIRVIQQDIEIDESRTDGVGFAYKGEKYDVSIPGRHQAANASLAIEAVSKLRIYGQCIRCKMKQGLKDAYWPCRLEKISGFPLVLDVTHTAAGSDRLAADVEELYGKVITVFGVLEDKDIEHLSKSVAKISSRVIIARPDSERAAATEKVAEAVGRYTENVTVEKSIADAIERALKIRKGNETVLVTGSFYMAGGALEWLKKIS